MDELQVKTGWLHVKKGTVSVITRHKFNFWGFGLLIFFLMTHSSFHQVEIASMQTLSIETLKHQNTWTFRQTGREREEKETGKDLTILRTTKKRQKTRA